MDQFQTQGMPGVLQSALSGQSSAQAYRLNELLQQRNQQENAVRGLDVLRSQAMSDPSSIDQYKLAQIAGFQGTQDDAALKRGTLQGNIGATNAKNEMAMSEKDNAMILQSIDGFLDSMAANQGNPIMALEGVRDPRMKQYLGGILQKMGPEGALQAATGAREKIMARMADSPTQRNAVELRRMQEEGATQRSRIAADASRYGADQRGAAGRQPTAETTDKAIARLTAIISSPEAPDEMKQQAAAQLQEIIRTKQQTNPMMNTPRPDIGAISGLPTTTPAQQAGGGRPSVAPQNLQDPLGIRR